MWKKYFYLFSIFFILNLFGCHSHDEDDHTVSVGTISGPETILMEVAKKYAKKCYDLNVKIVAFSDYSMPNVALNDGDLDANSFQHLPYLKAQIAARGYNLVIVGKTFLYPMGIYSDRVKKISNIPVKSRISLPNDPSNEARALLLLEQAGLITLKPGVGINASVVDIVDNPKKLNFVPLAAPQLPISLQDVTAAVINTNYAVPAGLLLENALYHEDKNSEYANIIVTREDLRDKLKIRELVNALHSRPVLQAAQKLFGNTAIPAWDISEKLLPCGK